MSSLSLIHIAFAFIAFGAGIAIFAKRKGTQAHRMLGWAYVISMLVSLTGIVVLRSDTMPPFAWYAVFTAFVAITAVAVVRLRATSSWRAWHGSLMAMTMSSSVFAMTSIVLGVASGHTGGPVFYRMFNVTIVVVTVAALFVIGRSRVIWAGRSGEAEAARRRFAALFAGSSLALAVAQLNLAV